MSSSPTAPAESNLGPRARGAGLGEIRFEFGTQPAQVGRGFWGAVLVHGLLVAVILLGGFVFRKQVAHAILPETLPDIVFLDTPGPGGGGGGGGNKSPEPPKQVPKVEVPVQKAPVPVPEPTPEPPKEIITAPVETLPTPEPPAVIASAAPSPSQGTGTANGAGTGTGTGIGSGQGSGIGAGIGGGIGGGYYQPGNGVTSPEAIRQVKPQYTADAMRAKIQGTVWIQCVVLPDGTCGNVQVTKSLDRTFGLDEEAMKAARQWRFKPGIRQGEPVPVLVTIELTFTLR
jgi:TonB family protein